MNQSSDESASGSGSSKETSDTDIAVGEKDRARVIPAARRKPGARREVIRGAAGIDGVPLNDIWRFKIQMILDKLRELEREQSGNVNMSLLESQLFEMLLDFWMNSTEDAQERAMVFRVYVSKMQRWRQPNDQGSDQ